MIKILSIDGGGIRGIIPAMVLAEIEKKTGKSISELFNMIAGTSTGGILALGITVPGDNDKPKFTANDLIGLYENNGRKIFDRSFWRGVSSIGNLFDEKYSHEPLEEVLKSYLGDTIMKSAKTKVLVSAYDIEHRTPYFFKSWRNEYNHVAMWRVGRATSAAPTYFEPAQVDMEGELLSFVDGGVFINNPAVSAYAEIKRLIFENEFPDEPILVVSLGTGQLTRPIKYEEAKGWGLAGWAIPILNVVFDGVSDAVDYQLSQILGPDHFYRFQTELNIANDDMDNASRANIEALKAQAKKIIKDNKVDIETVCTKLTT